MYPDTENNKTLNMISKIVTVLALIVVAVAAFIYTWSVISHYFYGDKEVKVETITPVTEEEQETLLGDLEQSSNANVSESDRIDILNVISSNENISNEDRGASLNSLK